MAVENLFGNEENTEIIETTETVVGDNTGEVSGDCIDNPTEKVMTSDELDQLASYKKQLKDAFRAEKEASDSKYQAQLSEMMNVIEELKKSQMKDDERKRYEEQKRIDEETKEKLALAERNKALEAEIQQIRTAKHINDTMSKYPFIEQKYRDRFSKMTREEFDRNFTDDFVQDQRELAEYRKRDNEHGNRNVFGGTVGKISNVDPRATELKKFKEDFLNDVFKGR